MTRTKHWTLELVRFARGMLGRPGKICTIERTEPTRLHRLAQLGHDQ